MAEDTWGGGNPMMHFTIQLSVTLNLPSSFPDSLAFDANGTNPQTMRLSLTQFVEAEVIMASN
jgi:hypothetical protein